MADGTEIATLCLHLVTESGVGVIVSELGNRRRLASPAVLMQCRKALAHIWICLDSGLICGSHAGAIVAEGSSIDEKLGSGQ